MTPATPNLDRASLRRELTAGGITLGSDITFQNAEFESPIAFGRADLRGNIRIGAYSYVTGRSAFKQTYIGRFCSLAPNIVAGLSEHPAEFLSAHPFTYKGSQLFRDDAYLSAIRQDHPFRAADITVIGNDVWIGEGAFIRRGTTIGDGAIVAARAVVVKDVPPFTIVGGTPARVIRQRFTAEIIERLLRTKWWELDLRTIEGLDFRNVADCSKRLEDAYEGMAKLHPPLYRIKRLGIDQFQLSRSMRTG